MTRDIRINNMVEGQKIESDLVIKRMGEMDYRNMGTLTKSGLFDAGKFLIVGDGLRIVPSSGMTVSVPSGTCFQRSVANGIIFPCIQPSAQTVTLDAASGSPRTDIIEGKVTYVVDKDDTAAVATIGSGEAVAIANETIKRDIKYYLSVRKQTGTTTPTAATAGTLTGTVAISGTVDLSEKYLLNLAYGEDGSFQEIDLRGATPEATTLAEIVANINTATGATAASIGGGDVAVITGQGTGEGSYFQIKPPVTDADKDALEVVFGVSVGGVYRYEYRGVNEWIKLAEFDVGAATTTITAALIRNVSKKNTWASGTDDVIVQDHVYQPNSSEWNEYDSTVTYSLNDVAWLNGEQYVSLANSNTNKNPVLEPNYWHLCPTWHEVMKMYNEGVDVKTGFKKVDHPSDGSYQQWHRLGYFRSGGSSYEAYKIHLDGTVVTGNATLISILGVGGASPYWNLDLVAPDSLGTRTLLDTKGRYPRVFKSGVTAAMAVAQADQMQGFAIGSTGSYALDNNVGSYQFPVPGGNANRFPTSPVSDGANGTPRTGSETRGMNYTVGVPYVVIIKPI